MLGIINFLYSEMKLSPSIAVLIPTYNEEVAIAKVIGDFHAALPHATLYVYDNNSTDKTVEIAQKFAKSAEHSGKGEIIIRHETQQGKGHVMRRMFRDVEADFYIMVDGDDTYDAAISAEMFRLASLESYDFINAVRIETHHAAYRHGHKLGNNMITGTVRIIFGDRIHDMLSGYKLLSRRFVKSFPMISKGFDIETELAIHALELDLPIYNIKGNYRERGEGSVSKLNTFKDGWKILMMIMRMVRHEKPLFYFGVIGILLAMISVISGIPLLVTWFETGLVPRFPTAILATGLMIIAGMSFQVGIILDTVTRGRREIKLLNFLQIPTWIKR